MSGVLQDARAVTDGKMVTGTQILPSAGLAAEQTGKRKLLHQDQVTTQRMLWDVGD